MRAVKPDGSSEIDQSLEKDIGENIQELTRNSAAFRQPENGDGETLADTLVREAFETARQQVMQLTDIISESVKKLPTAPSISP
jgi:hypothetical protein